MVLERKKRSLGGLCGTRVAMKQAVATRTPDLRSTKWIMTRKEELALMLPPNVAKSYLSVYKQRCKVGMYVHGGVTFLDEHSA